MQATRGSSHLSHEGADGWKPFSRPVKDQQYEDLRRVLWALTEKPPDAPQAFHQEDDEEEEEEEDEGAVACRLVHIYSDDAHGKNERQRQR